MPTGAVVKRDAVRPACEKALRMANAPGRSAARDKDAGQAGRGLVMSDKPGRPPQRPQETHPSPLVAVMAEKAGRGSGHKRVVERMPSDAGQRFRSSGIVNPVTVARRIEGLASLAWPCLDVLDHHPSPAEVASWLVMQAGSARGRPVVADEHRWRTEGYAHLSDSARRRRFRERLNAEGLAEAVERIGELALAATVLHGDAAVLVPGADLEGCVVYMDPPYVGCTPYAVDCPRDEVLRLAREYSAAGATVAISEACPLADELGSGWDAVELTHERRGQVNPHRRVKSEWLTLNRPPAGVRGVQIDLLGAA